MAQKVSKKYALNISGIVNIDDDNRIWISVEDVGDFVLDDLMQAFDGNECKISVGYEEDLGKPSVDAETGEIVE